MQLLLVFCAFLCICQIGRAPPVTEKKPSEVHEKDSEVNNLVS